MDAAIRKALEKLPADRFIDVSLPKRGRTRLYRTGDVARFLADGTIDCIATDHAPHTDLEKDCEFEAASVGINGLESAIGSLLGLVRDGVMKPSRFVETLSSAPARLLPDYEGGTLREGAPADVTLLDPEARWILEQEALRSKSHNTPLLGREMTGRPVMTIVGGRVVHELEL